MAQEPGDKTYVCKLDQKSKEVAKIELKELNDKDREIAVQTLRQWVLDQPWLKSPTDFEFLLRFLRVRKFSQLEARKSLENYWTSKTLHPKWFLNVDPADEGVLAFLKSGVMYSPKKYDKFGRRVVIFPAGKVDGTLLKKYGVDTLYKYILCVMDWLATDEYVQVNGVASFYDHTDIDYLLLTKLWTPSIAKDYMHFFQKAVPIRHKTFAVYNESSFLDVMLSISRPFMTEKVQKRIKTYGKSLVNLYNDWGKESLTLEYLPDDYTGPCLGNKDEVIDEMMKEMLDPKFRDYIKDISCGKYGVDTNLRKMDTDEPAASFRKLNVD
ncbi:hypothetical protein ACF0H5_006803 [Mactra antiquata]